MKRIAIFIAALAYMPGAQAQSEPMFKGLFYDSEHKITIRLDLDSETVKVPGLDMLGGTNGYMSGGLLFGTWFVTDFKKKDGSATLRLTNDFGADTQEVELTHQKADTFSVVLRSPVVMRKAVKNKLVKIGVTKFTFVKK